MKTLFTIDAEALMSTPLPSLRFVMDKLLPQGLHILAGAPKIGKSWLALQICLCVARGNPLWEFPSTKGTVLYLCLEDSYARIQQRLFELTKDAPSTLHFANLADGIGSGLEEQLKQFLAQHPDTKLVVIDTLQKVRRTTPDANPYANDYRDISVLKSLADEYGVAILLIHHLRKMIDDAPPAAPTLNSLSVFLSGVSPFDGTATELSELLELHTGEKILPSVLSKRLARYASELDKAGIQITTSRTRDARTLHISARPSDGNDGNDGKNDTASV